MVNCSAFLARVRRAYDRSGPTLPVKREVDSTHYKPGLHSCCEDQAFRLTCDRARAATILQTAPKGSQSSCEQPVKEHRSRDVTA